MALNYNYLAVIIVFWEQVGYANCSDFYVAL